MSKLSEQVEMLILKDNEQRHFVPKQNIYQGVLWGSHTKGQWDPVSPECSHALVRRKSASVDRLGTDVVYP